MRSFALLGAAAIGLGAVASACDRPPDPADVILGDSGPVPADSGPVPVDGGPDAGDGGLDGGDAGPDGGPCAGLTPGEGTWVPYMRAMAASSDTCGDVAVFQVAAGDQQSDLAFSIFGSGTDVSLVDSKGAELHKYHDTGHLRLDAQNAGFIGVSARSNPATFTVVRLDPTKPNDGLDTQSPTWQGFAWPGVAPSGALFAAGRIAAPAQSVASRIALFNPTLQWNRTLSADADVFGIGVDEGNRALVVQAGGANGAKIGQWYDSSQAAIGGTFTLLDSFTPTESTWFELSPTIGGGLALRRIDFKNGNSDVDAYRTSEWLRVIKGGAQSAQPAPDWLASRPNTRIVPIRGGRAYAVLRESGPGGPIPCGDQLEILTPAGDSCGKFDYKISDTACRNRGLSVGRDGTLIQQLPWSHGTACNWRFMVGLLR